MTERPDNEYWDGVQDEIHDYVEELERDLAATRKAILSHHTIYRGLALWTCKECGGSGRGQQDIDHGPAGGTCWVAAALATGKETP